MLKGDYAHGFEPWSRGTWFEGITFTIFYFSTLAKGDESGFSGSPNFQLRYPIGERIQFLEV